MYSWMTRIAVAFAGMAAFVPLRVTAVHPTVLPAMAPGLVPLDFVRGSSLSVPGSAVVEKTRHVVAGTLTRVTS